MKMSRAKSLKSKIRYMQEQLNSLVCNEHADYKDILKLSQELDTLIVKYQELLLDADCSHAHKFFWPLNCA